ncbi:HD domain-containing protein [Candidatus Woesearchaeota archaeon]|jgi:HD superfamily phosphodiesterase|nr:HD domain-containing protein [Candidatus Woesearchaeota archaeon]MBT6518840.1 HD domain-containing protein [Candidatus Woesearchaeota archaeon]MBT7367979.1 HD domain-containing protein [Candidatus Woesearchaeota archaeon]
MKEEYELIWKLAKPYYLKGREMDVSHIDWMMQEAEIVCEKEGLNEELLLPLVILHDVGYAEVKKGNPFDHKLRVTHMKAGAQIALRILNRIEYSPEQTERIAYFISVHDNWALGDYEVYKKSKILAAFNDLDFIWLCVKEGFEAVRKILGKNHSEMIEYLEAEGKLETRNFATKTTKELFENSLEDRKKEIKK